MTKKDLDFMLADIGIHDFVLVKKEDLESYHEDEIQESDKSYFNRKVYRRIEKSELTDEEINKALLVTILKQVKLIHRIILFIGISSVISLIIAAIAYANTVY